MDGSRTGGDVDSTPRLVPPESGATPVADLTPEQDVVLANIELKAVGVVQRAMIDSDDAKDVVQETMFRMWKQLRPVWRHQRLHGCTEAGDNHLSTSLQTASDPATFRFAIDVRHLTAHSTSPKSGA